MADLNWLELLRHSDFCVSEQMSAPSDEYESEAEYILALCKTCAS
jgi:hypothetical protein